MGKAKEILAQLKESGTEQTRKTYIRHGHPEERTWGVSIANIKLVAKKIKGDQELALEIFESGMMEAMYLAGLVADGSRMTKAQLETWMKSADGCPLVTEYTVPWVVAENKHARPLALKWMKSRSEGIATGGWSTYSGILSVVPDEQLSHEEILGLLHQVETQLEKAKNKVRYSMNNFVISVGSYVPLLLDRAKETAKKIGKVSVDMGQTSCKVPVALEYIRKVEKAGRIGKKRRNIRC